MRTFINDNKVLLIILAAVVVSAAALIGGRMAVENDAKTYDVVLDYQELDSMVRQSEHDMEWWLNKFKSIGINKVALTEENLETLMENTKHPISAEVMYDVVKKADWEKDLPEPFLQMIGTWELDEYDVLVVADSYEDFHFVADNIVERYQEEKYLIYEREDRTGGYIMLNGGPKDTLFTQTTKQNDSTHTGFREITDITSSKLMYLSIGFLPEKLQVLENAGVEIIPRTSSYPGWNDKKYVESVLEGYESLQMKPSYLIIAGQAIMGQDDSIEYLYDYVNDNNVVIALIENTTQRQNIDQEGLADLVKATDYNATRIFSVWDYIQNRYQYYGYEGAKEIENTLFRAITERNVRIIYYKPIKEFKDYHAYVTEWEEYETMFLNLEDRLADHGMSLGRASIMDPYQVSTILKIVLAIGCAAAGTLLLAAIFPIRDRWKYALFILAVLGVLAMFFVLPSWAALITSFAASILFACLITVYVVGQSKNFADNLDKDTGLLKLIGISAGTLAITTVLSLVGGIMTAAPLSEINFMLEMDIFRGVKVAQLLPLAFFIVAYLAYYGFGAKKKKAGRLEYNDIIDMLNCNLKVWMVLIGAVGLAVGAYYITRTGHDSNVTPSAIEIMLRNGLEDMLLARPRNKEFLFAFPSVMLMVYTSVRKFKLWPIMFGLCSVIGITSVINTFMHIRTPLYLGFVRTGFSLLFGLIIGIILILVFEACHKAIKKIEVRLQTE